MPFVVELCPESVIAGVPWEYQVVLGGGVPLSVSEGVSRVVKLHVGIVYWGGGVVPRVSDRWCALGVPGGVGWRCAPLCERWCALCGGIVPLSVGIVPCVLSQ